MTRSGNRRRPALPRKTGSRPEGRGPVSDLHEDTPRAALFRRAIVEPAERGGTRAGHWGRPSLAPAVRLRWPPPGEHAAALGSASLVASPRLRAGRRLGATAPCLGNGCS